MNELINGTAQDAIEKLAALAAARRTSPFAVKAAGVGDFLSSLGEKVQGNPALGHALLGGGLGAAAMGVNTAFNNRGKDEAQKRSVLGSVLTGGLAGAGIGAGVGAARQGLDNLKNGPGANSLGSDALKPGQFIDPATGGKMVIDPKALKENPELHKQVKSLTTPTMQTTLAGGFGSFLQGVKDRTPTSASILPWVAGADAALHAPGFGLARIDAGRVGGRVGTDLLQRGVRELAGKEPNPLQTAIMNNEAPGGTRPVENPAGGWHRGKFHETHDTFDPKTWAGRQVDKVRAKAPRLLGRPNPPGMADLLGRRGGADGGTRTVATTHYTPVEVREVEQEVGGPKGSGTARTEKVKEEFVKDPTKATINEGQIAEAKRVGHGKHEGYAGRQLYKLPFTNKTYAGMTSFGRGAALRAGLYGAPLAAEYLYRGLEEDTRNKETLRELMARYAKPAPEGK